MKRLLVGLLTALAVLVPAAAHADGAAAQGWWTVVNGAVPPDVGPTDLLLQGGDPARALPNTGGVVDQSPMPTALAALRFAVAPASQVGALVLQVSIGARAAEVRAYPAKADWLPVQGGALADAPDPDLSRYSAGTLSADGATLVFPDIGRLTTEAGVLSVVLVPGALDRVVVHKPTAAALAVAPPEAESAALPPAAPAPAASSAAGPLIAVPVLPRADSPVLPGVTLPAAAPPAPSVAPAPAPLAAAPVAAPAALTRRLVPDDSRSRLIVLVEIALVVGFFGLMGQGPLARLAGLTGAAVVVDDARGIGRFRTARSGPAPRL